MQIISDLHIHSKYSRGCSKQLDIKNLEKYGRIKGVDLLGTGDFQHPEWLKLLKSSLSEDDSGILKTETGYNFVLSTEIALVYTQAGKGRRVHMCALAPSFDVVDQVAEMLLKRGRIDYDGRPIFKMSCPQFVEELMSISRDIEVFPAHIWTPWFSMFGSKSGFDSVKECFMDKAKFIHAYETGLSSDAEMNWRVSQLDRLAMLSNSDTHSYWPWRIGREATIFNSKMNYKDIIDAIRTRDDRLFGTVEVDPGYGKYHFDGHRNCNISLEPKDSAKTGKICPVCKKPLTIGVLNRVEELADRPEGFRPEWAKHYYKLIPLSDLISAVIGKGVATKGVWKTYYDLMKVGRSEMDILLNATHEKLMAASNRQLADAIIQNRRGKIEVIPGYDGMYGIPRIGKAADRTKASKKTKPGPGDPDDAEKCAADKKEDIKNTEKIQNIAVFSKAKQKNISDFF